MIVSQEKFHDALRDPAQPVPAGLTDAQGHPAGKRFNVYRNNVALSLIEALRESFPALARILQDDFTRLAHAFMRQHAPDMPVMQRYGARLPGFLQSFTPLAHLPWLSDLAGLEQTLRESYHAADADPVPPQELAALPPETLSNARFTFAPAVRLVQSDWPIHDLLESGNMSAQSPQSVLITRPGWDPIPHLLDPAQALFLAALIDGATLAEAHAVAEDCDLTTTLQLLLQQNAICEIRV